MNPSTMQQDGPTNAIEIMHIGLVSKETGPTYKENVTVNPNAAVPGDPFWNGFLSGIGACGLLGAITVANLYAGVAVFAVGLGFVVGVSVMKRVHQVRSAK